MKPDQGKRWTKRIDWLRLLVAMILLTWLLYSGYMSRTGQQPDNLNTVASDVFAVWVFLTGLRHLLTDKQKTLGMFFVFFATMMLITVNYIALYF